MVDKQFCFVVASYNNKLNIEKNLQSIINQSYKNWRVIYINDCSTDNTEELFFNIIKKYGVESKFTYIKNEQKRYQMYSKYNAYKLVNDFEIVCLLDGDDWLSENNVLETLVNAYSDPDVSVVTSNYNVYKNGKIIDNTYIPNYDENTILTKSYRKTKKWCLRHLKTGYGILFKSIPQEYLKFGGKWLEFSTDLAEMFSVLELSNGKFLSLKSILYTYNYDNSVSYENSWFNVIKNAKNVELRKTVNNYLFDMAQCSYYLPYTYIINMPKDTLKKQEIIYQLQFQNNTTFKFINAVEGKKDIDNFNLMKNYSNYMNITNNSDKISFDKSIMLDKYKSKYNFSKQHITRGSLGLIQSIFLLFNDFIKNEKLTHITIFEDDIYTLKNFQKCLYINHELLQNKDLVYLGCHNQKNNLYSDPRCLSNIFIDILDSDEDLIYGTYAMIISKKLATYIIELGIDSVLKLNLSWDLLLNYIRETNKSFSFFLYHKELCVPNVVKYGGVNEFRGMDFYIKNNINLLDYYLTGTRELTSIDAINEFLLENTTTPYFNFIEKVVYINLAERTDRKQNTERALSKYFQRSKIRRFDAIKHTTGGVGCGLSHIGALEMAIKENWENVLILEDDIEFVDDIDNSHSILETIYKNKFDVILLGGSWATSKRNSYKLIKSSSALAYLVNKHYYKTLLDNFKESNANLARTIAQNLYKLYALDVGWQSLQSRDKWFIVKPGMCYQRPSYSDIENKIVDYRDAFFKYHREIYTFNVLITSTGSDKLQNMLNSLSGQLGGQDCLTIVYDGLETIPTQFNFTNIKCKIQQFCEPVALGYWGHGIRNKYANLLEEREFIMHGDETDVYIDGIFEKIRDKCIDIQSLYIFKILYNMNPLPKELFIQEGNIGTPCGVIPYELNKKGTWLNRVGGDGVFYEQIAHHAKNIVYSDMAIYKLRPNNSNNLPVTSTLNNNKRFGFRANAVFTPTPQINNKSRT